MATTFEELLDYRRSVTELYARLRHSDLSETEKCRQFRKDRNALFGAHPQSALSKAQKINFPGLRYYPYNPAWRFTLPVNTDVEPEVIEIELQEDGLTRIRRFG